jgi:prepilin-type N-terminal cleavage/methylation domain-containing protein
LIERLKNESGYSLVEVMVSIMLLSIAIIPMVGMFDMGLKSATKGSNYDEARAFANQQLELAKVLPYQDVRDSFPIASSTPNSSSGAYTSSSLPAPASANLPSGFTYTVKKQYVLVQSYTSPATVENSSTDSGVILVTITVNWTSGSSITISGLVSQRTS